ncbi:uncharacterized protein LOC117652312 isoform X2 [Thrips palmi]|uniref:Uncharacterized protein LOC117652312 isoform X2 n=1 Tax=Thrips palmi TaxID=161013 RepID=A0A6P9A662_THRPL|nr:uncharacterized protein LOC117652312 isoform X2 [Thrips palmi]
MHSDGMQMSCPKCSKPFDLGDKRPKAIKCGHSVCLTCLRFHPTKTCPIPGCNKRFAESADLLPDNAHLYCQLQIEFALAEERKPKTREAQERKPSTVEAVVQTEGLPDVVAVPREPKVDVKVQPSNKFWCLECDRRASIECIDRDLHTVRNWLGVHATRYVQVKGQLDALSSAESSLDSLQEVLDTAGREAAPELEAWRGRLEEERRVLLEARSRLEAALAGDAAAWDQAKEATPECALSQEASQLLAHLSAPSASFSFRFQAGDSASWSASLAVREDPLARHLLCRSLLKGCLQREALQNQESERLEREQERLRQESLERERLQREEERLQRERQEQERLEQEQKRLQQALEEQQRLQRERLQHEREERDREAKKREEQLELEEMEYAASAVQWEEKPNEEAISREEATLRIRQGCKVFLRDDSVRSGDVVQLQDGRALVLWGRRDRSEHSVTGLRTKPGLAMHYQNIKRLRCTPQFDLAEASRGDDIHYKTRLLISNSFEQMRSLVRLRCDVSAAWTERVLEQAAPSVQNLVVAAPSQRHLAQMKGMPLLQRLYITTKTEDDMSLPPQLEELYFKEVTPKVLAQVPQLSRLKRLEIHCTFASPLPVMTFPRVDAGLQWLRVGVYPLATGMALVRAHSASLEELELVAAADAPYGCPDIAHELRRCKLKSLKRMVLLREARDAFCRHEAAACRQQKVAIWNALMETGSLPVVLCSVCDDLVSPIVID